MVKSSAMKINLIQTTKNTRANFSKQQLEIRTLKQKQKKKF